MIGHNVWTRGASKDTGELAGLADEVGSFLVVEPVGGGWWDARVLVVPLKDELLGLHLGR